MGKATPRGRWSKTLHDPLCFTHGAEIFPYDKFPIRQREVLFPLVTAVNAPEVDGFCYHCSINYMHVARALSEPTPNTRLMLKGVQTPTTPIILFG
jgi:hypothetical protein